MRYATPGGSILLILAACRGSPEPVTGPEITTGLFEARVTAAGLELTNHGSEPVYYLARDPLALALTVAIPCVDLARCPGVAGNTSVTVPLEEAVVGYQSGTERAIVYWWHLERQADGSYLADAVRSFQLTVRR